LYKAEKAENSIKRSASTREQNLLGSMRKSREATKKRIGKVQIFHQGQTTRKRYTTNQAKDAFQQRGREASIGEDKERQKGKDIGVIKPGEKR